MRHRLWASVALTFLVLVGGAVWTVGWLLPQRADRLARSWPDLIWAARDGEADTIRELTARGADPDRRDSGPNGWTPLLHAVHGNQIEAVRALLAAGAEVDRPSPTGLTPLMMAASQGEREIVGVLLEAGADPRREHSNGMTALGHAVASGDPEIVRALVRKAPGLRLEGTLRDRAARGLAFVRGRSEVLEILEAQEERR